MTKPSVSLSCGESRERQEYAAGQPRPQTGAIGGRERAGERDTGAGFLDAFGPESSQFISEQGLDAFGAGGKKYLLDIHAVDHMRFVASAVTQDNVLYAN